LKRFIDELDVTLDKIERIFLAEHPYLCGGDISIGDLLGVCELMQPVSVGHDVFAGRPKLEAWASRVKERLQPHFDEAHVHIMRVKDLMKSKI
jgi:glutathione S-transferase